LLILLLIIHENIFKKLLAPCQNGCALPVMTRIPNGMQKAAIMPFGHAFTLHPYGIMARQRGVRMARNREIWTIGHRRAPALAP
ncbi:hypothetical protein, partial [Novacetimonas hansenii]|uniref:hypothetical protein n=1 Tax=Novacetimonas hansenii TaxID=436 RepID=UPI0039EB6DA3